jgi:uncharacterized protein (TIGR02246 family)
MKLIVRYGRAADAYDKERFAGCFTADGVFTRGDGSHAGRPAIAAALRYPGGVQRRHFFTAPEVDFTSGTTATGRGSCLYFEFATETDQNRPPISVDYEDEYRLTEDGWRIALRTVRPSFA